MVNYTGWFTEKTNGKIQINSLVIYKDLSSEILRRLERNLLVGEIIKWIRNQTKEVFKARYAVTPEVGALNNASGRWNEFIATSLLSEIVLDMNQESHSCIAIFSLPSSQSPTRRQNEVSSKFLSLFSNNEFANGKVLAKVNPFKEKIFLPSSDYIIAVLDDRLSTSVQSILEQQAKAPDSFALYNFLMGKLQVEQVRAAISLKTSNRPDRRYQPLFEAAMIKAMGYVLRQNWRYYMVATELSNADDTVFSKAVAPHGIALEQDFNLVDGTYLYTKKDDLVPLVKAAIQ